MSLGTRVGWWVGGWLLLAAAGAGAQLTNGGFEQGGADGAPAGWITVPPFVKAELTTDQPHTGQQAVRLAGDGQVHAWRRELGPLPTRIYRATAWYRARGVEFGDKGEEDFARLYVHVLYQDRPYADATHHYLNLPAGSYDWRQVAVRIVPRTQWPIAQVWVTVVGQFRKGTMDCDDVEFAPATGGTGAAALEWAHGAEPVVLSDMSRVTPAKALTTAARPALWRVLPYEAGNLQGKLLWATADSQVPEVTLKLGAKGWHAVYLGLVDPAWVGSQTLLRLSRDPAPVPRRPSGSQFEEMLFKVADLTGQDLHLSRHPHGPSCGVAYVKLVPLSAEEVAREQARRADTARRRLVTTLDGFSFIYERGCVTAADLRREVEVYRDTDFGTLLLQPGGADMTNYPSQVGEMGGQNATVFDRDGDRRYALAVRELARRGINPTRELIAGAHDAGMKVHMAIRPGAWEHSPPMDNFFTSRFYREHPQWRCVDRDGTPVARLSLAVPEVRAHLVAVLREAVSFGADGACVLYVRGAPYVLYEPPFAALFQQRYGVAPQTVDEQDPRVLELRAEILTTFMGEIRAMLDEVGRKRGQRLQLSAMVLADEADNRRFGLDVAGWVKAGLVDLVLPYLHAGGGRAKEYDLAFFRRVCAPAGVPVKPTVIGWETPDLASLLQRVGGLYDQGADGVTVWDGNSGDDRSDRWCLLSRLGSAEDVRQMTADGPPGQANLRFHKLGGVVMDGHFDPNWGY